MVTAGAGVHGAIACESLVGGWHDRAVSGLPTNGAGGGIADLDRVLDAILSPLAIVDRDLTLVAANTAYCAAGGRTKLELIGASLFEVFPDNPLDDDDTGAFDLRQALLRVFADGCAQSMPLQRYDVQATPNGPFQQRFWSITTSPIRHRRDGAVDYAVVHAEEITSFVDERLRAQAADQQPRTAGRTEAFDAVFAAALRHSEALKSFAEALVESSTVDEVARAFIHEGIDLIGGSGGAFIARGGDRLTILHRRGMSEALSDDAWSSFIVARGVEPFSDAIVGGEPLLFWNRADFLDAYPHLSSEVTSTDHHAWAVFPLTDGSTQLGAIGITFDDPDVFSPVVRLDLDTVTTLTTQATSRARLLAEQAETIDSINRILLADLEANPTVVTSTLYRPATQLSRSGGDWFDVISLGPTSTLLAVGDIADHGPGTTGEMMRARATLQSHAVQYRTCSTIAQSVSTTLARFSETFATASIVLYDSEVNTISWTTAGHPYPLFISASGDVALLRETHGPPLGVPTGAGGYLEAHRQATPGDTLVLYTDGLIERRDDSLDDAFDRLEEAARSAPDRETLAEHLYRTLLPSGIHADDVAILVATFTGIELDTSP
jgi:Stage II sporulation protein E (SpoIIE)/PAS fold